MSKVYLFVSSLLYILAYYFTIDHYSTAVFEYSISVDVEKSVLRKLVSKQEIYLSDEEIHVYFLLYKYICKYMISICTCICVYLYLYIKIYTNTS
jgi:hypothetical protein